MTAVPVTRTAAIAERWRPVLRWWGLSRLVTLAAFGILELLGPRGSLGPPFYSRPLAILSSWDGVWYSRIAQHGYLLVPGRQSDTAFFPLYPLVLRAGNAIGVPPHVSGPIVSNLALAVALVAFYELGRHVVGESVALRATIFAAVAPMSFVYSMTYPMSALFALGALATLFAYEDRWLAAAACAAGAGLTRPEAIAFALPIAQRAWTRRRALGEGRRGVAVAAVLAAPVAVATYPLYLKWALGDVHAWSQAERRWGRSFRIDGPIRAIVHVPAMINGHPGLARDVVLFAVYAALLIVAARAGIGRAWVAAGAAVVVLPLFSGTFESEGRFGLIAFPLYWALAIFARTRRRERAVIVGSISLLGAGIAGLPYIWP